MENYLPIYAHPAVVAKMYVQKKVPSISSIDLSKGTVKSTTKHKIEMICQALSEIPASTSLGAQCTHPHTHTSAGWLVYQKGLDKTTF